MYVFQNQSEEDSIYLFIYLYSWNIKRRLGKRRRINDSVNKRETFLLNILEHGWILLFITRLHFIFFILLTRIFNFVNRHTKESAVCNIMQ